MDECCICCQRFQDRVDKIVIIKHSNDDNLNVSRKRGHYFHHSCISEWRREHGTCPLDRNRIARLYTVPGYQIVGLELGLYNYDYRDLLRQINVNNTVLDQLSSVDEIDKNNRTLAFYACKVGNYSLVTRLLKREANFNRPCGRDGFTPLMAAVCHYHSKIVTKLLTNRKVTDGIDTYDSCGHTAWSYACQLHQADIIKEFIDRKLVTTHGARYQLELHRADWTKLGKQGTDIISLLCHYLKTDGLD